MRVDPELLRDTFAACLPAGTVLEDPHRIEHEYRRNVTALNRDVPLVLRPQSEADVARIVRVANEHGVALHPISTGKNWGLGSKLPVQDGVVIVDLSALDQIHHVSETGPYAILGPGVTQGQLARYLAERHPDLTLNLTGSFARTSIVGNVLDRGDGSHARIDDLLGVRGVLGTGEPFQTGSAWDSSVADVPAHGCRYRAGPDLTGLFSQSNFGIVTQMAFRLRRRAERRYVFWGSARDEDLERVVDTFRYFGDQGLVEPGSVNVGYANRFVQALPTLAAGTADADLVAVDGPARFPSGTREGVAPVGDAPEWNFYALVTGTRRTAEVAVAELHEAFAPFCSRIGMHSPDSGDDARASLPEFLHPLVGPLLGIADDESIRLIYRWTGVPEPADPAQLDADHTPFGMKCCIPSVPVHGRAARRVATIAAAVREHHAINLKLSFFGDGRTLLTIHFRTDDPEQVRRATACEVDLWRRITEAGFPPYRLGIDQMERLFALHPDDFALVQKLKAALDPGGIIAPGRYCPVPRGLQGPRMLA